MIKRIICCFLIQIKNIIKEKKLLDKMKYIGLTNIIKGIISIANSTYNTTYYNNK